MASPDDPNCPHAQADEAAGVRLVQLGRGESGRMASADLTREDCELLHALGLTDQCLLRVCQAGDPCIVQVRTTRIGLSQRMAERIRVVPTGTD